MKTVIREGVYETNSSSMHSVTHKRETDLYYGDFHPDRGGYVHTKFGKFGWGVDTYFDSITKLSYAATMVAETEEFGSEDEFYKTAGMKAINELIQDKCHCNGVCVDYPNFQTESYTWNGETRHYMSHNGYIDHQSSDYKSLQDFLNDWDITLERFIFDDNVGLIIDNDNH